MKLLDRDNPNALGLGKITVLGVILRPTYPNLDHALGVKQPLLTGPPKWRTMGIHRPIKIRVKQIRVAVKMDHPNRRFFRHRPQDRQG